MLAACDKIALAPLGDIAITGPTAMPIHVKGLLDKLGVQADFIHVGAYKGAAEPLTLDAPSKEMLETLGAILDRRYATMVDIIAQRSQARSGRGEGADRYRACSRPSRRRQAKLVDEVTSFEMLRDEPKAPWTKLELEPEHRDQLASYLEARAVHRRDAARIGRPAITSRSSTRSATSSTATATACSARARRSRRTRWSPRCTRSRPIRR